MGRITVITQHLSSSDLNYTILKQFSVASKQHDLCWAYENDCPPFTEIPFPRMSVGKIWEDQSNDGYIIATSLESASLITGLPNLKKKLFYIWSLEFMWGKTDFFENYKIFNSINLVTRSESYAKLIQNYCNKKPLVIENFDLEKICQSF